MVAHRRPKIPYSDAPRGECRWCGDPILYEDGEHAGQPNRRRRWHASCVDVYNSSDPREARRRIRKRDRGRCAACRVDTYAIRLEFKKMKRGRAAAMRERGFKPGQSLWELDHIVPLCDGGSHDDDNLQTLCAPCHKQKTAQEAIERAARARTTAAEAAASETDAPARDEPAAGSSPATHERTEPIAATAKRSRRESPSLDALLESADTINSRVESLLAEMHAG